MVPDSLVTAGLVHGPWLPGNGWVSRPTWSLVTARLVARPTWSLVTAGLAHGPWLPGNGWVSRPTWSLVTVRLVARPTWSLVTAGLVHGPWLPGNGRVSTWSLTLVGLHDLWGTGCWSQTAAVLMSRCKSPVPFSAIQRWSEHRRGIDTRRSNNNGRGLHLLKDVFSVRSLHKRPADTHFRGCPCRT